MGYGVERAGARFKFGNGGGRRTEEEGRGMGVSVSSFPLAQYLAVQYNARNTLRESPHTAPRSLKCIANKINAETFRENWSNLHLFFGDQYSALHVYVLIGGRLVRKFVVYT